MTAKTDQTEGIKCVQNLDLALEKKKNGPSIFNSKGDKER